MEYVPVVLLSCDWHEDREDLPHRLIDHVGEELMCISCLPRLPIRGAMGHDGCAIIGWGPARVGGRTHTQSQYYKSDTIIVVDYKKYMSNVMIVSGL